MHQGFKIGGAILILCAFLLAQAPSESTEIAPGFKLRPDGVIDIGDAFCEINYYDSKWTIAQQHDKFQPSPPQEKGPTTQPNVHEIIGVLTTAQGPANYRERVEPIEGGIKYSAELTSDKPLDANEVSMAFILPNKTFGGKQITVDQQPLTLPMDAPKNGEAMIQEKDLAHEVHLPMPNGTLIITGDFKFLIQDDREWGDPRYSMRLFFTPGSGQITQCKIALEMKMKANS